MNFEYSWILEQYGIMVKHVQSVGHDHLNRNKVYAINNEFILKVYGKLINWERELESLSVIKGSEFHVPRILDFGFTDDQEPWTLMSKIPGEILAKVESSFDKFTLGALYYEIGIRQARFHKCFNVKHLGEWVKSAGNYRKFQNYFEYEKKNNKRIAEQSLERKYPEHELLVKAYEKMVLLESKIIGAVDISLCHNDFSDRNIIVEIENNELKYSGLIDFELSQPRNIENDIVKMIIKTYKKELSKYYFEGYLSENNKVFTTQASKEYNLLVACFDICRWARKLDKDYYDEAIEIIRLVLDGSANKVFSKH